eukprot:364072-Chlamydomonas_euryale.AAC.1
MVRGPQQAGAHACMMVRLVARTQVERDGTRPAAGRRARVHDGAPRRTRAGGKRWYVARSRQARTRA